jgi:hypothetical protein
MVRRWANVRPRAVGRDPMLGPVPAAPHVLAMAGGFKISFGIAHRMADCLIALTSAKGSRMCPRASRWKPHRKGAEYCGAFLKSAQQLEFFLQSGPPGTRHLRRRYE